MSSPDPNQPNLGPPMSSSAPSVDTRAGRKSKRERGEGGGAVHGIVAKLTRKMVWIFAGVIFAGIFFWGILEIAVQGPNPNVTIGTTVGHFSFDRFLLFAGIMALIPPAIMYFFDSKRRDAIDNNIPHLIRDIADAGRSGMTLTRAIEISAERDYGPLTTEIKKLIAKISFRVPLEKALQFFADRTGTMLSRRTSMLVAEANKSGGDIQESMESVAKHVQEIQYLERKRRATLRPFIGVMYISFAVFLVTVYLLISSFFKQLANTNFGGGGSSIGGVGFNFISLPLPKITAVFLYMGIIEALFAGLVGGKMASGYIRDGLKHAIMLMLICFITFVFFV
jgi:archaeal flagellar protein FlaJ